MNIRTFEDELFPQSLRWEYALGNIAADLASGKDFFLKFEKEAAVVPSSIVQPLRKRIERSFEVFVKRATSLYPSFENAAPQHRIGVMSLMIPIGCNARCPSICYTDIEKWRRSSDHLTFEQTIGLLAEFKSLGGRLVRIIGDGEPVLYSELPQLAEYCEQQELDLIVFTNGVILPARVKEAFEKYRRFRFYGKLWSEEKDVQNAMVVPRIPYIYRHFDDIGNVPLALGDLYEIDRQRVGFQVMFSSLNEADAWEIINGPKGQLPILIEDFIAQGAGAEHFEFRPSKPSPATKACTRPERSSYLAVVNSYGRLQAGTFVPEGAIPVVGKLGEVWSHIFTFDELFCETRYPAQPGCFCERFRSQNK